MVGEDLADDFGARDTTLSSARINRCQQAVTKSNVDGLPDLRASSRAHGINDIAYPPIVNTVYS